MNFQLYDLKTLESIPMTIFTNHLFFKNVVVLLVLYEARTENSATCIPTRSYDWRTSEISSVSCKGPQVKGNVARKQPSM